MQATRYANVGSVSNTLMQAHKALACTLTRLRSERRTSGGDKVEAFLTGPGGAVLPVAVRDLGNGCYTLSSSTNRPGIWIMKPLVIAQPSAQLILEHSIIAGLPLVAAGL